MKIRWLIVGLVVLFVTWPAVVISSGYGWNPFGIRWDFTNPGAFGDAFGPISAMMASAAALAAFAAFRSQAEEVKRLRKREQLQDDKETEAAFERTFFQLLEHHRKNVESIDIQGSSSERVGQDAFRAILQYMRKRKATGLQNAWNETFEQYENDLGHYFRFLYHVIQFVKNGATREKYFYVRIIRATLSESELNLLALNCIYGKGAGRFKALLEEFAMLHNISDEAKREWSLVLNFEPGAFEFTQVMLPDQS